MADTATDAPPPSTKRDDDDSAYIACENAQAWEAYIERGVEPSSSSPSLALDALVPRTLRRSPDTIFSSDIGLGAKLYHDEYSLLHTTEQKVARIRADRDRLACEEAAAAAAVQLELVASSPVAAAAAAAASATSSATDDAAIGANAGGATPAP